MRTALCCIYCSGVVSCNLLIHEVIRFCPASFYNNRNPLIYCGKIAQNTA